MLYLPKGRKYKMHKAILMAAGRGTRISRTIGGSCKCTLDVGGVPLIRHTAAMLLKHGIETHIVVGYQKELVFAALEGLPVAFHENIFHSVTNSIASLWWAKEELRGDSVILGNADVFWEENIRWWPLARAWTATRRIASMLALPGSKGVLSPSAKDIWKLWRPTKGMATGGSRYCTTWLTPAQSGQPT